MSIISRPPNCCKSIFFAVGAEDQKFKLAQVIALGYNCFSFGNLSKMNHLINVLKSGYNYTRTNEDGTTENILVAPNRYMISAAKALEQVIRANEQLLQIAQNNQKITESLQYDIDSYRNTIKNLEAEIAKTKV